MTNFYSTKAWCGVIRSAHHCFSNNRAPANIGGIPLSNFCDYVLVRLMKFTASTRFVEYRRKNLGECHWKFKTKSWRSRKKCRAQWKWSESVCLILAARWVGVANRKKHCQCWVKFKCGSVCKVDSVQQMSMSLWRIVICDCGRWIWFFNL